MAVFFDQTTTVGGFLIPFALMDLAKDSASVVSRQPLPSTGEVLLAGDNLSAENRIALFAAMVEELGRK